MKVTIIMIADELAHVAAPMVGRDSSGAGSDSGSSVRDGSLEMGIQCGITAIFCR